MASKRRNMFYENKKRETTEIGREHVFRVHGKFRDSGTARVIGTGCMRLALPAGTKVHHQDGPQLFKTRSGKMPSDRSGAGSSEKVTRPLLWSHRPLRALEGRVRAAGRGAVCEVREGGGWGGEGGRAGGREGGGTCAPSPPLPSPPATGRGGAGRGGVGGGCPAAAVAAQWCAGPRHVRTRTSPPRPYARSLARSHARSFVRTRSATPPPPRRSPYSADTEEWRTADTTPPPHCPCSGLLSAMFRALLSDVRPHTAQNVTSLCVEFCLSQHVLLRFRPPECNVPRTAVRRATTYCTKCDVTTCGILSLITCSGLLSAMFRALLSDVRPHTAQNVTSLCVEFCLSQHVLLMLRPPECNVPRTAVRRATTYCTKCDVTVCGILSLITCSAQAAAS
ncbi:hypothetical protein AAG570_013813 [Ranatra chinensis]|uniref:Uncharacterized protein n=1 Tax=Ranatra chinensis TaxID=642074 RepID=A0ABD0Z1I5_9HEMI